MEAGTATRRGVALAGLGLLLAPRAGWAAAACDGARRAALLRPPARPGDAAPLDCSLDLPGGQELRRQLRLRGHEASGIEIRGGTFGEPGQRLMSTRDPTIAIWSRPMGSGGEEGWSRPADITIRDAVVNGTLRIWGIGADGTEEAMRQAARRPDFTRLAQQWAPTRILIENVTFRAAGGLPLYIGPGVTRCVVRHCRFEGFSDSTAIYLDAESAENEISGNVFALRTGREAIAVDGSARNRIAGNSFRLGHFPAVSVYRNCGEGGVIRHQEPSGNVIEGNLFEGGPPQKVVLGARGGRQPYCGADAGYPFGSSADDGDHAADNIVRGNRVR